MSAFLLPNSQTVSASTGQRHTCRAHSPGAARLCGPRTCQLSLVTALLASLLQASLCNGALFSNRDSKGKGGKVIPVRETDSGGSPLLFYFVSARGVGGGVWLIVHMRIFQASPSRT